MVRWPRKICISCSYSLTATQLKQRLRQGRSSKAHPTSNAVLRNFNKNEVSSDFKKASDMPIRMWPKIDPALGFSTQRVAAMILPLRKL